MNKIICFEIQCGKETCHVGELGADTILCDFLRSNVELTKSWCFLFGNLKLGSDKDVVFRHSNCHQKCEDSRKYLKKDLVDE